MFLTFEELFKIHLFIFFSEILVITMGNNILFHLNIVFLSKIINTRNKYKFFRGPQLTYIFGETNFLESDYINKFYLFKHMNIEINGKNIVVF